MMGTRFAAAESADPANPTRLTAVSATGVAKGAQPEWARADFGREYTALAAFPGGPSAAPAEARGLPLTCAKMGQSLRGPAGHAENAPLTPKNVLWRLP